MQDSCADKSDKTVPCVCIKYEHAGLKGAVGFSSRPSYLGGIYTFNPTFAEMTLGVKTASQATLSDRTFV